MNSSIAGTAVARGTVGAHGTLLLSADLDEAARIGLLMDFDQRLKARDINPGTSADLTVACLLVQGFRINLRKGNDDG